MFGGVFGLSLLFVLALCWHCVRTNQASFWLWIILLLQPLGGIAYVVIVLVPDLLGGSRARRVGQGAVHALDPGRGYRAAQAAYELAPTPRNGMKLAEAATARGRHDEAERLYGEAASGVHADDPALLLGRARALVEMDRHAEALAVLQRMGELGDGGRTPAAALAMARAYEGLGRPREAEDAYGWALERLPGFEAPAYHVRFLAGQGRRAEAETGLADLDARLKRLRGGFRVEARAWRDLAARALGRPARVRSGVGRLGNARSM